MVARCRSTSSVQVGPPSIDMSDRRTASWTSAAVRCRSSSLAVSRMAAIDEAASTSATFCRLVNELSEELSDTR